MIDEKLTLPADARRIEKQDRSDDGKDYSVWMVQRPSGSVIGYWSTISTHDTKKEAEAALAALLKNHRLYEYKGAT